MIKLIVSDIDGTLVKDGTLDINPEYMDVIRKLTEKGIHFVACSGRQYSSEKQLFAPVKDIISYISDGGTLIRTSEKILKVHTLSDEIWKNMARMAKKEMPGCDYLFPVRTEVMRKTRIHRCSDGSGIPMDMTSEKYRIWQKTLRANRL